MLAVCLAGDPAGGARAAEKLRAFTVEDLVRFKEIDDVRVSPDGRRAVFTVRSADLEAGRYETDLWMVDLDGAAPARRITSRAGSETFPRWAPDGRQIAFLAKEGESTQVWSLPLEGGEARRLTSHPKSIASFDWAPDSRRLVVVAPPPDSDEEARRARERDDGYVLGRHWRNHRAWIAGPPELPPAAGAASPVPAGPAAAAQPGRPSPAALAPLTDGRFHVSQARWSADGARLALLTQPTPEADADTDATVQVVELAEPRPRQVPGSLHATAIEWSPDGGRLAFLAPFDGHGISRQDLFVWEPGAREARNLSADVDRDVEGIFWARNGRSIDMVYSRGAVGEAERLAVEGAPLSPIQLDPLWKPGHAVDAAQSLEDGWVYVRADRPHEVWITRGGAADPRPLTGINSDASRLQLPSIELARWNHVRPEIEGVVYKPAGYDPKRRYPLVVRPHGGPRLHARAEFDPLAAYLAGRGFVVLRPNFRGSTGYGDAFARGNVENWGQGPFSDIMAGADMLVARGAVDPDRLFIYGWSYGGYMANWSVGQTHRFRAAVSGAGVADLRMQYTISDARRWRFDYFRGSPFLGNEDLYRSESPVSRARLVRTPVLFIHGENDTRCPLPQGLMMYHALRDNGVETELVIYPREDHDFAEPRHVMDRARRIADWFDRHDLKPPPRR